MTMHTAQVIVVGAGPAGATAAYFLAQAGVDVLMVDKATFPRDKACGDGIGLQTGQVLEEMGLIEWLGGFNRIERALVSAPDGSAARFARPPELLHGYVVPRRELDARLVETAIGAGARLEQGVAITGLETSPTSGSARLLGKVNGKAITLQAPLAIAADGATASFTRRLGLVRRRVDFVAVRAYFEDDGGDPGQIEIHWEKALSPGYGWIFPLGDGRANVGVGSCPRNLQRRSIGLRAMLDAFVQENAHARARLQHARRASPIVGHPLRTDATRMTPFIDHVLVVGDAAGLTNPFTGEGLSAAMVSGHMAAAHAQRALESGDLTAHALSVYGRAFHRRFDRLHRSAYIVRAMLRFPWLINRSIRRAEHDEAYARQIVSIFLGKGSPAELLMPGMAMRTLLG